jgi:hypothetical protein
VWDFLRVFLATFSTAALVGAGSFAVGALLGFLLVFQRPFYPRPILPERKRPRLPRMRPQQEVNTNLEQVSDPGSVFRRLGLQNPAWVLNTASKKADSVATRLPGRPRGSAS